MKPLAKKKARAMSQGIGSPKAEKAAANVRVLVRTQAPRPMRATAPRGRGCVIIPTMVDRKMERSCQAILVTPVGGGMNHRITPVAMEAIRGCMEAPCHGCSGFDGTDDEVAAAAEALTVRFLLGNEELIVNPVVVPSENGFERIFGLRALDLRCKSGGDLVVEFRVLQVVGSGRNPRLNDEVRGRDAIAVVGRLF